MTGTYVAVVAAALVVLLIAWMIESWQKWDDERREDRQWLLEQSRLDDEEFAERYLQDYGKGKPWTTSDENALS